ncbi:MAG: TonB-dependent receptor [Deltaproteobacteria bacterium]|jgi:outer membrane receptor protein involved in Fe transport
MRFGIVFAFLLLAEVAIAQPAAPIDESQFEQLNLDRLLQMEVSVASLRSTTLRESPGIVTVISRDEIISSGARDLVDVLMMVPGLFFAVDVQGVVGIGIRGQWAHEGKLLLIVDDQEMNELGYQTLAFGHHYPVEAIERIEIIRGPGSAIYGGNAELGVIKVTTRRGDTLRGARAAARYATPRRFYASDGDKLGLADVTVEVGDGDDDFEWSVSGLLGRSTRSDALYTAIDGTELQLGGISQIRPGFLSAGVRFKRTSARLIIDRYGLDSRDAFDAPSELTHPYRHAGLYAEVKSALELAPGFTLTPRLTYKQQQPWFTPATNDEGLADQLDYFLFLRQTYHRYLAGATVSWDAFDTANLVFGVEAFYDYAVANAVDDPDAFQENLFVDDDGNDVSRLDFFTTAFFGQLLWPTPYVNITAGARMEIHDKFGFAAVPRLALTRVFDFGLHAKLLAAQAFRTPSFQNTSLETAIDPDNVIGRERTSVLEAEVGYQFPFGMRVTANGFYTRIDDPLIYVYDEDLDEESYFNRGTSATIGAELEVRQRLDNLNAMLTYSHYSSAGTPIEDYDVEPGNALLGAPRHKITARVAYEPIRDLFITPSLWWLIDRYAVVNEDEDDPVKLSSELVIGLAVTARNLGVEGLDLTLAGHDLLDTVAQYPQPYRGYHSPLPGQGRQFMLRLAYEYGR